MPTATDLTAATTDSEQDETGRAVPPVVSSAQTSPITITRETEEIATFEALKRKHRRTDQITVHSVDEDGAEHDYLIRMEALDGPTFDALVEKHPAKPEQQRLGALYNGKTLTPALIAACVYEPKLSLAQWKELAEDPNWSGGEIGDIFNTCWRLCNAGLDVSFIATG